MSFKKMVIKICNFIIFDLQWIENQTADCNILNVRHHALNENVREYKENVMWPLKDTFDGKS